MNPSLPSPPASPFLSCILLLLFLFPLHPAASLPLHPHVPTPQIKEFQISLGSSDAGLQRDAAALLSFKRAIKRDPTGALELWRPPPPAQQQHGEIVPCSWPGVQCDSVRGLQTRVVGVDLSSTSLLGSISPLLGALTELRSLVMPDNKLMGTIPKEILNCSKLALLDLRNNNLTGDVPSELTRLRNLQTVLLSNNKLSGSLDGLFRPGVDRGHLKCSQPFFPQMKVLDLKHNYLRGRIPQELGSFSKLVKIDLSSNQFSGPIPSSLGRLGKLVSLSMSDNSLSGQLPANLASCKNLTHLSVANNFLTGIIPPAIANLSLLYVNVSNNNLLGPIPQGKWLCRGNNMESFSGNPELCGWPLKACDVTDRGSFPVSFASSLSSRLRQWLVSLKHPKAIPLVETVVVSRPARVMVEDLQVSENSTSKNTRQKSKQIALGIVFGAAAGVFVSIFMAAVLRFSVLYGRKQPNDRGDIIFDPRISRMTLPLLDVEGALTDANLLGAGGNGRVYKARMGAETEVAVKVIKIVGNDVLYASSSRCQVFAELKTVGRVRHRNLIPLLAYMHRSGSHYLFYKLMPNGSLQSALQKMREGELDLTWPMRLKIALGVANALDYLHNQLKPRILHRDVKPGNILLDDNFEARLSDFGLAKLLPNSAKHISTRVAGTLGYIAPEYYQTCRFSEKGDIYSFGVVLAVLLTGREPTEEFFTTVTDGCIAGWILEMTESGRNLEVLDPHMLRLSQGPEEQVNMLLALKVAIFCTLRNPQSRPTSQEVYRMLTEIDSEPDTVLERIRKEEKPDGAESSDQLHASTA